MLASSILLPLNASAGHATYLFACVAATESTPSKLAG